MARACTNKAAVGTSKTLSAARAFTMLLAKLSMLSRLQVRTTWSGLEIAQWLR
jgi:hypothetical protein